MATSFHATTIPSNPFHASFMTLSASCLHIPTTADLSSQDLPMPTPEPFDAEKIITLWTELLTLQIDLGYYPDEGAISFPPPEGRPIDEAMCQEFNLSSEVVTLIKRLPCPSTFDGAWDTPIFNESVAVSFADSTMIRGSRDLENRWIGPGECVRPDYMNPEDLTLVMEKDESGYHLIPDTKASKQTSI